jgi:hypothetical protein
MKKYAISAAVALLLMTGWAFADTSLVLSTVLPGFTKISSYEDSELHRAASSLIRSYAAEVDVRCISVEVFHHERATSLTYSKMMLESFLPFNSVTRELLSSTQQIVLLVLSRNSEALAVLYRLDGTGNGNLLIACG